VIVADTSAILAVLFGEPERQRFVEAMWSSGGVLLSAATVLEARMVMYGRRGHRGVVALDRFLRDPLFEIVAPGPAEIDIAYDGFVAFGKGSGHPAALNFGDLFAYSLARTRDLPLLFKGDDFSRTDVRDACPIAT